MADILRRDLILCDQPDYPVAGSVDDDAALVDIGDAWRKPLIIKPYPETVSHCPHVRIVLPARIVVHNDVRSDADFLDGIQIELPAFAEKATIQTMDILGTPLCPATADA